MTWQRFVSNVLICIAHPILTAQAALEVNSERLLRAAREREAVSPSREQES